MTVNVPLFRIPLLFASVSEPEETVRLAPLAIVMVLAVATPVTIGKKAKVGLIRGRLSPQECQ